VRRAKKGRTTSYKKIVKIHKAKIKNIVAKVIRNDRDTIEK
jgi:hypothetical protein